MIAKLKSLVLFTIVLQTMHGQNAWACGDDGSGFLPENTLNIPVGASTVYSGALSTLDAGMTETKFNGIIDKINDIYASIVAQKGATLQFVRAWSDGTVNAYADRSGSTWTVKMYGGLARHPATTADGFALVVCHELGHHLGGSPYYAGRWAATEGQADYFSTLKCLRRVWLGDENQTIVKSLNVPPTVVTQCEKSFSDANEIAICQRTAMAGLSSGNLSQALDGSPQVDFTRPDPAVVGTTFESHPKAQCRLDTYFQASLCQVKYTDEIGQSDPTVGTCSTEKGATFGYRPLCWYKPGGSGPNPNPTPTPTPGNDIAANPTIGGQTDVTVPAGVQVFIDYDVSTFRGATGVYVEIVGPNRDFVQPNGTQTDPYRILWGSVANPRGRVTLTRPLGYGVFRVRVLPLGGNGTFAVGRFSNASTIRVQQRFLAGTPAGF